MISLAVRVVLATPPPGDNTVILGESGSDDRIRVVVTGDPAAALDFTALTISAGIETLVVDNITNTAPVDWVVSQGTIYFVDGRASVTVDTLADTVTVSGFSSSRVALVGLAASALSRVVANRRMPPPEGIA